MKKTTSKNFKMPSAFTISLLIIVAIAILTWFVPAGAFKYVDPLASKLQPIPGTYYTVDPNPQGIWEIIYAPIKGFFDAKDVALFVLVIGGFLAVVMQTGALNAGISRVLKKLDGKIEKTIPVLMILFALGGTSFGMCEESIPFYMMIIPIFVAAGYDVLTPFAVIFLGAGIGCLGSTVNPFSIGIASGFAGVSIGEGILLRVIILIVSLAIGIVFVMRYAKKVKNDPSKSLVYNMKEENEKHFLGSKVEEKVEFTKERRNTLIIFGATFIVMVLGVIPWAGKFNITIFEDIQKFILNIPILGKIIGNPVVLGDWWFGEMTLLFLVSAVIIGFVNKFKEEEFISIFIGGARDLLGVAFIIAVCRGITVVMNDGHMTATVLHAGETVLKDLGPLAFTNIAFLFYIPLSFLVPSTSGLATLSMPIMAPLAGFANVQAHIVITAFATASGIVNFITPTSAVVMGVLLIARVDYLTFIKFIWKVVLALAVASMVIMSIASVL
jgi:uncharacterized ion transporter superfamily protein YfcC